MRALLSLSDPVGGATLAGPLWGVISLVPQLRHQDLTLLCRYHHHNFLSRGWDCQINPDGLPEWRPPRWVDRDHTPLINNRIRGATAAATHRRQ